jgi:hypothetical protein
MPGSEDYRQFRASLNEALIELKALKARKTGIDNHTFPEKIGDST